MSEPWSSNFEIIARVVILFSPNPPHSTVFRTNLERAQR